MRFRAEIKGENREKLKQEAIVRHEIIDDRLKDNENRRVRSMIKPSNIQDLWVGVLQPAGYMHDRTKGWQAHKCLRQGVPPDYAQRKKEKL